MPNGSEKSAPNGGCQEAERGSGAERFEQQGWKKSPVLSVVMF